MDEAWLQTRTYHHKDFADLDALVELKRAQRLTVSVALPTLNVAPTLRPILASLRESFGPDTPLIDQLAIVDSRSEDETLDVARSMGVEVYFDDELLPGAGAEKGKGEALWKSLAALTGDIIIWIDSDIENFDARFVYGLLGPLLTEPEIQYVRPFYRRPLHSGTALVPTGGGRVTEICARPLINMFFPSLAGFIQPLAGEHAGRREVFENVPFFTGYAVEIGLAVEIFRKYGLFGMAQVDLEERVHHNQPIEDLCRMSDAIMQATVVLLKDEDRIQLSEEPAIELAQPVERDGHTSFQMVDVTIKRRPPLATLSEYAALRGSPAPDTGGSDD